MQALFATMPPEHSYDPVILPLLLSFIAIIMWIANKAKERTHNITSIRKWWAFLPIGIAVYFGWPAYQRATQDEIYQSMLKPMGDKFFYGHYAALFIPLVTAAIMGGWQLIEKFNGSPAPGSVPQGEEHYEEVVEGEDAIDLDSDEYEVIDVIEEY